jgi:hypothetical protein
MLTFVKVARSFDKRASSSTGGPEYSTLLRRGTLARNAEDVGRFADGLAPFTTARARIWDTGGITAGLY